MSAVCALTGATIRGDAVLIPLAPARYVEGGRNVMRPLGGTHWVSNEGATALFTPLTLPIAGRVEEFGDLRDIEEGPNTRFIEATYGMKISEFAEAVHRGHRLDEIAKISRDACFWKEGDSYRESSIYDGTLWGCHVAREAWDLFSTASWDDRSGKSDYTIYDAGWLEEYALRGMGFSIGEENKTESRRVLATHHDPARYCHPCTHPELPGVVLWYDGYMSSEPTYNEKHFGYTDKQYKCESSIHNVAQLDRGVRELGLELPKNAVEWAKSTPSLAANLDEARRQMHPCRDGSFGGHTPGSIVSWFSPELVHTYRERIFSDEFRDLVLGTLCLVSNFYAANQSLRPSIAGPKYGHCAVLSRVAQMASKLAYGLR